MVIQSVMAVTITVTITINYHYYHSRRSNLVMLKFSSTMPSRMLTGRTSIMTVSWP